MNNTTELAIINDFQIEKSTYNALKESLYPGASDTSIAMVLSYCKARNIDPMLKPVHLVPMNVKSGRKGSDGKDLYEWRDVVMPGIGLYRIDASRSGQYAGISEPEFGEDIIESLGAKSVTYPKWCKITVRRLVAGRTIKFTVKEFWKENYATAGRNSVEPNAMWFKRPYAQLAKCCEAQALRKAFPEVVGQEVTGEEMEGKTFEGEILNKKVQLEKPKLSAEDLLRDQVFCQEAINACESTDELKEVFTKLYRQYSHLSEHIIKCKDLKKSELELNKISEIVEDTLTELDVEGDEI